MFLRKGAILLLACAVICSKAFPQRYNFISYSTDEGLPQSQVFGIAQSVDRQLWISTYAGISRFDGKAFYNYTIAEGLASNFALHFVVDYQQRTWSVTNTYLNLVEGNKVYTYTLPEVAIGNRVRLAVTQDNVLWCLVNGVLYSFRNNKFIKETVSGFSKQAFLSLIKGEKGAIFLMAPHRTLYHYKGGSWQRFVALVLPDSLSRVNNVYIDSTETIWVLTQNELLVKRSLTDSLHLVFKSPESRPGFICHTKDKAGNIWIGGNHGAYKVKPDGSFMHFDETNGLTEYRVHDILRDAEGNIWLATDGDGLLKYGGGVFTSFGNTGNVGVAQVQHITGNTKGSIWFGNTGNDFCIYNSDSIKQFPLRNTALRDEKITYVLADTTGAMWICTLGSGVWKYQHGVLKRAGPDVYVYGMLQAGAKTIFCYSEGLLVLENGKLRRNPALREFARRVVDAGQDSLFVALSYGLVLIKDTTRISYPFPADLQRSTVVVLEKRDGKIFVGTLGGGIFVWNKATGRFNQFTTAHGLASNIIYSLKFDNTGHLWAGTGQGVSRLSSTDDFSTAAVRNYGKEQGLKGAECNSNAIAVLPDNTMWFGTAKGLYCYHPDEDPANFIVPQLALKSIKIFSKPWQPEQEGDGTNRPAFASLPPNLVLPHGENHITFEFRAISYSYNNIHYSYFLQGLEQHFSVPDVNEFVVYPLLPPGDYVFMVKATDEAGKQLGDVVKYPFSISPAFYQTTWFRILLALAVIAAGWLVYNIRKNNASRQKKLIENLRAEEQRKIRKETARDFHDEMGNKLARITILSDILKTKLPAHEEAQGLAKKIQENVTWLYQGTKDIIWSLNPENDNLYFLFKHISDIGVDLFVDTEIEFRPIPVNESFKDYFLPMDYARNIIMICKEAFTNILKHSKCSKVKTTVALIDNRTVKLTIADNGKGFDPEAGSNGNGLTNIKQRTVYLGAAMELQTGAGEGTGMVFTFTLPAGIKKVT